MVSLLEKKTPDIFPSVCLSLLLFFSRLLVPTPTYSPLPVSADILLLSFPFFPFLHSSVPLFLSKPLPASCHPSHLPPESSSLESGQRNSKKIIIIPQKTPPLGGGVYNMFFNLKFGLYSKK